MQLWALATTDYDVALSFFPDSAKHGTNPKLICNVEHTCVTEAQQCEWTNSSYITPANYQLRWLKSSDLEEERGKELWELAANMLSGGELGYDVSPCSAKSGKNLVVVVIWSFQQKDCRKYLSTHQEY